MFENYKPVTLVVGMPTMTVTENGITFSKAAICKLRKPRNVFVRISEEERKLAIIAADEESEDTTLFFKSENRKSCVVRWNSKDFLRTLEKLMGWKLSENGCKIEGEYFSEENALLFDLGAAKKL